MAQVATNLSESVDPVPQSMVNTDELLLQLAGSEIDRLLADVEADAPALAKGLASDVKSDVPPAQAREIPSASNSKKVAATAVQSATDRNPAFQKPATGQVDAATAAPSAQNPTRARQSDSAAAPLPAAAATPADDISIDQQLDALFAELNEDDVPHPQKPKSANISPLPLQASSAVPDVLKGNTDSQLSTNLSTSTNEASADHQLDALASKMQNAHVTAMQDEPIARTAATDDIPVQVESMPTRTSNTQHAADTPNAANEVNTPAVADGTASPTAGMAQPANIVGANIVGANILPADVPEAMGVERSAVLEAAGFEDPTEQSIADASLMADPVHEMEPVGTERSALMQAAGFESGDVAAPHDKSAAAALAEGEDELDLADQPLPIYLRPLEWMNAPLAKCSVRARQILGKAAIVTIVNAIAVLTYVLVFRKHS